MSHQAVGSNHALSKNWSKKRRNTCSSGETLQAYVWGSGNSGQLGLGDDKYGIALSIILALGYFIDRYLSYLLTGVNWCRCHLNAQAVTNGTKSVVE